MGPLVPPRVNMNGTSKNELVNGYREIMDKIRELQTIMNQHTPNGRDYQTLEPGTTDAALKAYGKRYGALTQMYDDFLTLAIEVSKQGES